MSELRSNADQEKFWDAEAGPIWVRNMQAMDICLAPVLDLVLEKAGLQTGEQVLDIGCGGGTSSFAAAQAVGPAGSVLGADISSTLLAHAHTLRGDSPAVFVDADAETYPFEPASRDVMISRFGVMFFEHPTDAFRNMARALRPGGRMVFATWGAIPENPFFVLPAGIAKAYLGPTPKTDPDAPGPFSLRDVDMVLEMLKTAGLQDAQVDVCEVLLTPTGGAGGFTDLALEIGPAAVALAHFDASNAQQDKLRTLIADAVAPYLVDGEVRIPAQINVFSAVIPTA
jgi:hypothetical protein